jgi:hypothetical protein
MRIALVDNLLLEWKNGAHVFDLQPHLGLISLIAVAEAANHEAILFDPKLALARGELRLDESLYRLLALRLADLDCDAVGFTTLGCNFICTLKIADHFKRACPGIPILLGGPHATILYQEVLAGFEQFDVIVRGEAETSFLPLLKSLGTGHLQSVPGIAYRDKGTVVATTAAPLIEDLDALPFPAYEHYPIAELGLSFLRVEAGRGCPFRCTFCSTASFFGRKYRLKSAERLLAELDHLNARYGTRRFALTHDLFTVNKKKVSAFCDAVASRGYTWTCSARMDCVDASLIREMAAAGCRSIYYGVETGSQRMQSVIDKHLDLKLFDPVLDATAEAKIAATVSFITGYPEETESDQAQTLDLIGTSFERWSQELTVQLHLLTPEPGTKMFDTFKTELAYDGHVSDFNFPTLEPDDAEIMGNNPAVFMNHHFYRAAVPRDKHVFTTTIHSILYQLGFPVLSFILQFYAGSYSCLIADLAKAWAAANSSSRLSRAFVSKYFQNRWGPIHHLSSLVRYIYCAIELREAVAGLSSLQSDPREFVCLNPSARILRGIHDCSALLLQLKVQSIVKDDDSCLIDWGDYAMLCSGEDDHLRNFCLSGEIADLLEFARTPRSLREFSSHALGALRNAAAGDVIDDLVAARLLVRCGAEDVGSPLRSGVARAATG